MKKIVVLLVVISALIFTVLSRSTVKKEDVVSEIGEILKDLESYQVDATMEIIKPDDKIVYDIKVDYQAPNLYKVSLTDTSSSNEQIIIKNNEGVFVLTPSLKKTFKFNSDWPSNSSHPYIYQLIMSDVLEDEKTTVEETDDSFIITSKVNDDMNQNYSLQKISVDKKKLDVKDVVILDASNNPCVKVEFKKFSKNEKLNSNTFNPKVEMETSLLEIGDDEVSYDDINFSAPTSSLDGVALETSSVNESSAIYEYRGEYNYTIVECYANETNNYLDNEFDKFTFLDDKLVFSNVNKAVWYEDGIEYSIYHQSMETSVLNNIVMSI